MYTKDTYKYGRFIANMKASNALGTGSAFFLYRFESFPYAVFDEWNSMAIVPSLGQNEEGSTLHTKMSRYHLDEDWDSYDKFTLDNEPDIPICKILAQRKDPESLQDTFRLGKSPAQCSSIVPACGVRWQGERGGVHCQLEG